MPLKHPLGFRIGALLLGFSAILNAQLSMVSKFPTPRNSHAPTCLNCVHDLSGGISPNPAPVRAFRSNHPCPATRSLTGPCPGYLVDHIKPLNRGGSDTPQNMRWRTVADATKARVK